MFVLANSNEVKPVESLFQLARIIDRREGMKLADLLNAHVAQAFFDVLLQVATSKIEARSQLKMFKTFINS